MSSNYSLLMNKRLALLFPLLLSAIACLDQKKLNVGETYQLEITNNIEP